MQNLDQAVLVIVGPERKKRERSQVNNTIKPYLNELEKHRHNVRQILQCSNATPIMRRGGIGYVCSYCFEEFPEAMDLKKHTLADHTSNPTVSDPRVGYSSKTASMAEYNIKLDITNLECTECAITIDSLEDLMTHMQGEHSKVLYTDIKSHIIPFKFETDNLTCCLCPSVFDKFKKLQEHMHSHYRNYICDVCDTGFITHGSFSRHRSTHLKGVFPCSYCSKVFDTMLKKRSHQRCNHTHTDVLNRCAFCNKGFKDYHTKELHMSEVHGLKTPEYKCNACDRSYTTKRKLRIHVKKDHLLERTHKCVICDMRFFYPHDVKKHMLTHTGEREFQCEICLKSYGRKSTLSSHMRIHNNDRRFECQFCGMSFIQKCSWKGHLKTKHGEVVM